MRRSKYFSKKVITKDGTFDSLKELGRWEELCMLARAGKISELRRQVSFPLLPAQREESSKIYTRGKNKGKRKPGRVLEHGVTYTADFVYIDNEKQVVEDIKGMRTKDYIIKRKMMLYFHGIKIKEL